MSKKHDIRMYAGTGVRRSFITNNTSGREVMDETQDGQKPVIRNPSAPIVSVGYGEQLKKFTYDVVIENDSIFIKAVKKYKTKEGNSIWDEDEWVSITIFVSDLVDGTLKHYEIEKYRILGGSFGFSYIIDEKFINSLEYKDLIPAGKRLAWSKSNDGPVRATGRDLNVLTCSLPEVGEDLMLVSDAVIKSGDYNIKQYSVYETSYGKNSILGNAHGTETEYRAFPNVGDFVKAGTVLYNKIPLDIRALKKEDFDSLSDALLYTNKGLTLRRAHFGNHTLLKYDGRVVGIDIYYNPKSGENIESNDLSVQTAKYIMAINNYHREVVDTYKMYRKNFMDGDIDPDTNNLIVESMVYIEEPIKGKTPNISRKKKRSKLDMYTVKITIEHDLTPNNGWKMCINYGGKGVIKVTPEEDMPIDANGVRAEVAIFSKGITARTNLGTLYEQLVGASSRQTKKTIMDLLAVKSSDEIKSLSTSEIDVAYGYLLEYLSHYNTVQYKLYAGIYTGNQYIKEEELKTAEVTMDDKIEILTQIYDKELYIRYNVEEEESIYDIICRLEDSKFKIKFVDVFIKNPISGKHIKLKSRSIIAPMHVSLLNKISDSFLGASTFFLNGYGLPTGKAKDDGRFPYKMKQVRGWGESEKRLAAAYGSERLIQILMDRSKSIINHRQFYKNQMYAKGVTSECLIPNRVEDTDVPINIIKGVLESAGVTIETFR